MQKPILFVLSLHSMQIKAWRWAIGLAIIEALQIPIWIGLIVYAKNKSKFYIKNNWKCVFKVKEKMFSIIKRFLPSQWFFRPYIFHEKVKQCLKIRKYLFYLYINTISRDDLGFQRSLCTRPTPMQLRLCAF